MKRALIIGVNHASNESHLAPLRSAESDARRLAAALEEPACGFEVTLLLGEQATATAARDTIVEWISQVETKPLDLLIAFCGHGLPVQCDDGSNETFLVTADFRQAHAARDRHRFLSLRWLYEQVYAARAPRSALLMLDCCYAGDIATVPGERHVIDLFAVIEQYRQRDRAPVFTDRYRAILAATSPGQPARETESGGWMTSLMLPWLRGEQMTDTGELTGEALGEAIKSADAPHGQRPYILTEGNARLVLADYRARREERRQAEQRRAEAQRLLNQWYSPDTASRITELTREFVGREDELADLDRHLGALRARGGGYLRVTGVAGQGKSSLLAAWIKRQQQDDRLPVPAYFIRFRPGADEQVALLGHLMAELLRLHRREADATIYLSESANLIAARNSFATLLEQLSAEKPVTLVIDGLDQLPIDARLGERDLSFLPERLPTGAVIIVSARPDDTLAPLQVCAPPVEYRLPPLSLADFARLLERRGARLSADEQARLHKALHGNAFDLSFLTQELRNQPDTAQTEDLIRRVLDNPIDIFTPTFERLMDADRQRWTNVIRPMLGVLLVAQAPLSAAALRAALGILPEEVEKAARLLGGLLGERDWRGRPRYYLLHLKVIDYLRAQLFPTDDDRRAFHARLAQWCDDPTPARLWEAVEDPVEAERRRYGQEHLITHLAAARDYERLWDVLDADAFGAAQRQADPGLRQATRDLDRARAAVIEAAGGERAALMRSLPRLWRYSLLRVSLSSQTDRWPDEMFTALVAMGRVGEARDRAELLSDPQRRAEMLIAIGAAARQRGAGAAVADIFHRARAAAEAIADAEQRAKALGELAAALAEAG
ncbi:AAA family ATPase, partial [uncultured Chloroflexus sp.]|uniref:AAA family ATPase n=1 Tax=uncultured Chloroflexus sp. TaxID=214040 RepID=UPI0026300B18